MERLTERSKSKNSSMVWFKDENNNILLEPCEMSSHHSRMAIAKREPFNRFFSIS